MCYAISNNCKYKDAALELVEYLSTNTSSQRTQYKRGQCIPNLKSLAKEYETDSLGIIAAQSKQTNPCPANRSVWIDVIDGVGSLKTKADGTTYTDVITGRYRAESYSIDELWFTNLNNYISGSTNSNINLWKEVNGQWLDVGTVLRQYKPLMQADLDEGYKYLMRM
jgi:hypothetical protein